MNTFSTLFRLSAGVHETGARPAGKYPLLEAVTSSLVYVRLHGEKELYVSGYGRVSLDRWAERISRWRDAGRDVYVYFDNDVNVRAPFDALNLAARLGHGARVAFPTKALRAVEDVRGIELALTNWDRWNIGKRGRIA